MHNRVSVVIPVFNGARFIAQAIERVLDQTVIPHEIIVVNDGSTDGTLEVLAQFHGQIRIITIANGGVANARNVGIAACTGELIAFLDADDEWRSDKLDQQVTAMIREPDVGFCCCDYEVFDRHQCRVVNHFSQFDDDADLVYDTPLRADVLEILIRYNFVGTASSVMIRRSLLKQTGLFNTAYRQAEDYDLWLRCALVTKFLVVGRCLMTKRVHDSNLTNDFLDTLECHERVLLQVCTESPAWLIPGTRRRTLQAALAKTRYLIGNQRFESGDRAGAFACYLKAMRSWHSFVNVRLFAYYVSRKCIRLLSLGLVRRMPPHRGGGI